MHFTETSNFCNLCRDVLDYCMKSSDSGVLVPQPYNLIIRGVWFTMVSRCHTQIYHSDPDPYILYFYRFHPYIAFVFLPKINLLQTITYIQAIMCQWPGVQPMSTGVLAFDLLYSLMLCGLVLIVLN